MGRKVLIIGHRGASGHAPENTLAAFKSALDMGADGVELDVRLSSDRVPVVFHDADLERLFGMESSVSEKTVRSLKMLSFGGRFGERFSREKIPTLEEALDALKGKLVNVELKSGDTFDTRLVASTADVVRCSGAASDVILSSFNPVLIAAARRIAPEIKTAFLFKPDGPRGLRGPWAGYLLGTDFLNPFKGMVDGDRVAGWRRRGYRTLVWTVNEEPEMHAMIDAGVDGIITNFPDRLAGVLDPVGSDTG